MCRVISDHLYRAPNSISYFGGTIKNGAREILLRRFYIRDLGKI
jgi:hypothetical protein